MSISPHINKIYVEREENLHSWGKEDKKVLKLASSNLNTPECRAEHSDQCLESARLFWFFSLFCSDAPRISTSPTRSLNVDAGVRHANAPATVERPVDHIADTRRNQ